MKFGEENIDKIICINLKERNEKKKFMIEQSKKLKFPIKFFEAIKLTPGYKGCLASHLEVIKTAKKQNLNNILILEDDAVFNRKLKLPKFPKEWAILYLGGTVKGLLEKNKDWSKVKECWTTHSYIINSKFFDKFINDLSKYEKEVDRYYVEEIQSKYPCYVLTNLMTEQKEGYSDIENCYVDYKMEQLMHVIKPIKFAPYEITDEQHYKLKLKKFDNLPHISIITPTKDRLKFLPIALNNFYNFNYPQDKLEWIIIEESNYPSCKNILPDDNRIRLIQLSSKYDIPISTKRNIGVKSSKYNIICHMDDDDYYPPNSILSRVLTLMSNNVECVGCCKLGCYDLINNTSFEIDDTNVSMSEASMCYTKKFWNEKPFNEKIKTGEGIHFISGREDKILQIPYSFVLIAITHNSNITSKIRELKLSDKNDIFFSEFDEYLQNYLISLKKDL